MVKGMALLPDGLVGTVDLFAAYHTHLWIAQQKSMRPPSMAPPLLLVSPGHQNSQLLPQLLPQLLVLLLGPRPVLPLVPQLLSLLVDAGAGTATGNATDAAATDAAAAASPAAGDATGGASPAAAGDTTGTTAAATTSPLPVEQPVHVEAATIAPQTQYMLKLLQFDQVPRSHNIIVAASTWLLLVSFLLVPATFTGGVLEGVVGPPPHITNIGLLWVSLLCCMAGTFGCALMWFRWRRNYVWLLAHVFNPVFFSSAAGLVGALVNVLTVQRKHWSLTAKIATCTMAGFVVVAASLSLTYNFWFLERLRHWHEREFDPEAWQVKQEARRNENVLDKLQRKLRQKPATN
ncbi:hypothetical protein DV735_g3687, partial [Chaetothyriales sp. CBS 134920]